MTALDELNPAQREAVTCNASNLLILAGAGSGKTRVITCKIAWLIAHEHISPYAILAVTFTNKAAREMQERAIALEPACEQVQIRTFHSFGAWFLRQHAPFAGLKPTFSIYDDEDSENLIESLFPTLNSQQHKNIARLIARAKDYALLPDSPGISRFEKYFPDFSRYYAEYNQKLAETGNVDFGDLILKPIEVLEHYPEIQQRTHERFSYILVDEYQDSNIAQFQLLKTLAGPQTKICVVGDDDQSIYKFRGAEVNNILEFPQTFPNTTIIKLVTNYRSYQTILDTAHAVVSNNVNRMGKELVAVRKGGLKPVLKVVNNDTEEADFCASVIDKEIQNGRRYSDFAILYRTNAQSRVFEQVLTQHYIPFKVVGALRFFEREEVKDALAYAACIYNPNDIVACKRIINKPARGIGAVTFSRLLAYSDEHKIPILEACRKCVFSSKKIMQGIEQFITIINKLQSLLEQSENLGLFFKKLFTITGIDDLYNQEDNEKQKNLEELASSAYTYPATQEGLQQFLEFSVLDKQEKNSPSRDYVTLITIHNTKGLEYPCVFVTGLEQGLFPRTDKFDDELEEERRLFYVALTRAKDLLFLTYRKYTYSRGYIQETQPSLFLSEIPEKLLSIDAEKNQFKKQSEWQKGTKVYHDEYGTGWVKRVENTGAQTVIYVTFENGFEKTFILKYTNSLLKIKD